MRTPSFVIIGALALVWPDLATAVGAGAGATVLQEVQAPDLSRRRDTFTPGTVNTFRVSADLRPAASVARPGDQNRPAFSFSSPPLPPAASRPPPQPSQLRPQARPQTGPRARPQTRPQTGPTASRPVEQQAASRPVLDQFTVDVREINPPFVQQINEDGSPFRLPPPPTTQPPPQQKFRRPPPQFRRPPPQFRRPRPGRPQGRPLGPGGQQRPGLPVRQNQLQQLQQRFFSRPRGRAPLRRRSRRDVSADLTDDATVGIPAEVKQDRRGSWQMEYAMRKAADPVSMLRDSDAVPGWAPLKPEVRARMARPPAAPVTPSDMESLSSPEDDGLPIKVTEVFADNAEEARIAVSAGDEVYILRVPEEALESTALSVGAAQRLRWRDGRARVVGLEARSEESTARAEQPWWSRIPLLNRLIYREESTPDYTPVGQAAPAAPAHRAGYHSDVVVEPDYDPYLSVDGRGRPYYRTPALAVQANFENIPDQVKPVLNPTDDFVLPDNLEDPFRGGYAPVRPGYQYVPYVPYLPSPYYPPGDAKYHRRQQLFPSEIAFPDHVHKQRQEDGADAETRQEATEVKAEESAPRLDEADLERVIVKAAEDRIGEISVIDTGDHYAVISGDINKFVDFDAKETPAGDAAPKLRHSLADLLQRSQESASDAAHTAHSRPKRQVGLYQLRAPVLRRAQRRPIRRRDDAGRFPPPPPRVPAFRPPWESGRRVPRPGRLAPQRSNGRQPPVGFQPPAARPVFEQSGARPAFEQSDVRPAFEQPDTRPTFGQPDVRPAFEQPAPRPDFEPAPVRPAFQPIDARPPVQESTYDVVAGPPAQFGGFQPVTRPAPGTPPPTGADLQLSDVPAVPKGEASAGAWQPDQYPGAAAQPPPLAPSQRATLRLDEPRRTVLTTVPTPTQAWPQRTTPTAVLPSRPTSPVFLPPTRVVADQRPAPPQQQFAGSQQHQQVVSSQRRQQNTAERATVRPGTAQGGRPPVIDNLVTEEDAKPSGGSWASAALAGLSAILGGSSETTTESAPAPDAATVTAPAAEVPAPAATRSPHPPTAAAANANRPNSGAITHQKPAKSSEVASHGAHSRNDKNADAPSHPPQSANTQPGYKDGEVYAKDVESSEGVVQSTNGRATHKEELKAEPAVVKVVKRYRKRQRRPSTSSAVVSSTSTRRGSSRRPSSSAVIHRRRKPTAAPTPTPDSSVAASGVVPAAVPLPKRRVPFGARVRPTSSQRRRRPVARRQTAAPTTALPPVVTPTLTPEPTATEASQAVRLPLRGVPTDAVGKAAAEEEPWTAEATDEHVEIAVPSAPAPLAADEQRASPASRTSASAHRPAQAPASAAPAPETRPTTETPRPTEAPEQQEPVSEELPSRGGFRPLPTPPRRRLPPPARGQPAVYRVTTPAHTAQPDDATDSRKDQEDTGADQEEKQEEEEQEDGDEDVHSQLESYLSKYAEKYGLGLVATSPTTKRPTSSGRPAAPVSGLRWAHLAARARTPAPADVSGDEADAFVTGETDGDERVSVGSQYSYRVQLPPSRRVPPSLNSVRLRPKSKLAQLLGSSPRLRPSTAKPTIPWPAGYQPFTVTSSTPRPGRWAGRRERTTTTTTPSPATAWTSGPAWSRYADEFTTTERSATTTETPSLGSTRSRPIFIPPINRKRIRSRPLTLLHAGPRRPETTTTTAQTEAPTEPPVQTETAPAPSPVTEEIVPVLAVSLTKDAEEAAPEAIDDTIASELAEDEVVTSPEPVGSAPDDEDDDDDPLVASSEEPVGESSLFSVIYSKERPHAPRPQPEIFSRLTQFLAAHGQPPPSAPSSVSVTVGTSPIRVPIAAPPVVQNLPADVSAFQDAPEAPEEEAVAAEVAATELVTPDGAVIVQAVPAEAAPAAGHGSWVPTVQAVALAPAVIGPSRLPGTMVVYPEHMSQAEREANWPVREAEPEEEDPPAADNEWHEEPATEPESFHDLALSDDNLLEEVVYIGGEGASPLRGKTARLDDDVRSDRQPPRTLRRRPLAQNTAIAEQEDALLPVSSTVADSDAVGGEGSGGDAPEVVRLVHDPYGVFWTSPSGATNAEQAESQRLAGAFADAGADADAEADDDADADAVRPEQRDEAADDRTVNMCLDGKCMLIYEPGRQVRVQVHN